MICFMLTLCNFPRRRTYCVCSRSVESSEAGYSYSTESAVGNVFEETTGKVRLIIICKDIGEKVQSVTAKENC